MHNRPQSASTYTTPHHTTNSYTSRRPHRKLPRCVRLNCNCIPRQASTQTAIALLRHGDHTAHTVTSLHVLEGLVDLVQGLAVGDELIDLELAVKVVLNEARELAAALDAAERAALPNATGDQLEC